MTVDGDDIDTAAALQGEFAKACVAAFNEHAGDGIGDSACGDVILIAHPQRLAQPGHRRHAADADNHALLRSAAEMRSRV